MRSDSRLTHRLGALITSFALAFSMVPTSALAEEVVMGSDSGVKAPAPSSDVALVDESMGTEETRVTNPTTSGGTTGTVGATVEQGEPVGQMSGTDSGSPTEMGVEEQVTQLGTSGDSAKANEDAKSQDKGAQSEDKVAMPAKNGAPATESLLDEDAGQRIEVAAASTAPSVSVLTHIQNQGWDKQWTANGKVAGTSGKSLRMEAVKLRLDGQDNQGSLRSRAHVQNVGWQAWKDAGEVMGSEGASQRIEALQIELTGSLKGKYDVWYRVHAQDYGWMGWAKNGAVAGTAGKALRVEAIQVAIVLAGATAPSGPAQNTSAAFLGNESVDIMAHVQNIGWMAPVGNRGVAGSVGRGLRLEAMRANLNGARVPGGVEINCHVQGIGWQGWTSGIGGTTGRGMRVEAVQMHLTGEAAATYDLYYRAHVQNIGWLAWASPDATAGSTGMALRVEAIQTVLVPKNSPAPSNSDARYSLPSVSSASLEFEAYLQGDGWQGPRTSGQVAGTTGKGLRVEGFRASVNGKETTGGISYRVHVQNSGWQSWASNGGDSGSPGSGMRVEAIQISLTGTVSQVYNVWYRVHVQNIGWMGWTSNGNPAGTTGFGNRVEAVQVCLLGIGEGAPGSTNDAYRDGNVFANLQRASGSGNLTTFGGFELSAGATSRLISSMHKIHNSGHSVGMIMMDLNTGKGVACNPDGVFYSASTIKGPYVASLVDARPGLLGAEAWRIQNVLRYSDNEAYAQLRAAYGPSSLATWCANASVRTSLAGSNYTNLTPRELAKLWARAYQFFSGSSTGAQLGGWFQSPQISVIHSMLSSRYVTRTKAGWIGMSGLNATNDAGLVYAPNGTYVVAILTNAPAQFNLLQDAVLAIDAAHAEV